MVTVTSHGSNSYRSKFPGFQYPARRSTVSPVAQYHSAAPEEVLFEYPPLPLMAAIIHLWYRATGELTPSFSLSLC